jgi:hypothetical protein
MTAYVNGVTGGGALLGCSQHMREEVLHVREGDKRARKKSHRFGLERERGNKRAQEKRVISP